MYDLIIANKELLKVVYALLISFICSLIVLKSDRLFKLSNYQGLRYFRNAFFFYGLAFIVRFILGSVQIQSQDIYMIIIKFLFEGFIITAGLLLFYTLIWKSLEKRESRYSLFNLNIILIYLISILFATVDLILGVDLMMYVSQMVLFIMMSFLSYRNLVHSHKKTSFQKLHFITMVIGLIAWILNTALYYFLDWNKVIQMLVYGLNIIFFIIFFYGTRSIEGK